jgi:hypothetical protein
MDGVEGEEVARHVERNREWTQIYANLCQRHHLAALPTDRISQHLRPLASIRGLMLNFWMFQHRLMQVVDFHESFRYF